MAISTANRRTMGVDNRDTKPIPTSRKWRLRSLSALICITKLNLRVGFQYVPGPVDASSARVQKRDKAAPAGWRRRCLGSPFGAINQILSSTGGDRTENVRPAVAIGGREDIAERAQGCRWISERVTGLRRNFRLASRLAIRSRRSPEDALLRADFSPLTLQNYAQATGIHWQHGISRAHGAGFVRRV